MLQKQKGDAMNLKRLIEILEHTNGDDGEALEMATSLRELCAEYALLGQKAKILPGQIDLYHLINLGIDATIEAHLEIEREKRAAVGQ